MPTDGTSLAQTLIAALFTGGIASTVTAFVKARPEAAEVVVKAAGGALIVQEGVMDRMSKQLERLESKVQALEAEVDSRDRRIDQQAERIRQLEDLVLRLGGYEARRPGDDL